MRFRSLRLTAAGVIVLALASALPAAAADVTPIGSPFAAPAPAEPWAFGAATTHLLTLRDTIIGKQVIDKLPGGLADLAGYTGNDTCQWANDGECDDPGIGTGACSRGTDYSDCWRIATQREDDSCEWANDGECDEPHFGIFAVCTQGTDRSDCGAIAYLRFQDDSCRLAMNGICNEAGAGDGACAARTDRADCIGRDRPMQITDHYFGHDDRIIMDTAAMPWAVIGTLTSDWGTCTATLIAPDVLITAAHCIEAESGINAAQVFETAFGRGKMPARANVVAWLQAPTRAADLANDYEPSQTDWALLRIDVRLGDELGFLGVRGLERDYGNAILAMPVYQAGYSWDTGNHLSGNFGCSFLAIEREYTVLHNCDTTHGDSGSPLMVRDGDDYFIVAIDSTFRTEPGEPTINVATRSDAWIDYLPDFIAGRIGNTTLVTLTTPPGKK